MFEPFQKFLQRAAGQYGIAKEARAAQVCHDFRALLPELFPERENPQEYMSPAYYRENILVINVENPAWGHEVVMRKDKIIAEMNKRAGSEVIKNLRTQLKR